jgi:hypothetical protein
LVGLRPLPVEARARMVDRLSAAGGPAAALVMGAAAAGRGSDAFALGLICGVVFAGGQPQDDLREAAVRLEPLLGGQRVDAEAGAALAGAARRMLMRPELGELAARTVQAQAAALLTEVRAEHYAALSPALVVGLEARMRDAAAALAAAANSGRDDDVRGASDLVRRAVEHDRAADQRTRVERLEMAARLCRWLALRRWSFVVLEDGMTAYYWLGARMPQQATGSCSTRRSGSSGWPCVPRHIHWIQSIRHPLGLLSQEMPRHRDPGVGRSQVFEGMHGDRPLALLRLEIVGLALAIFIFPG